MSTTRRFAFRFQAAVAALLLAAACSRDIPPTSPEISLVQHPTNRGASYVAVKGIGSRTARALKSLPPDAEDWKRVFTWARARAGRHRQLRESFTKSFSVTAPDLAPLDPKGWTIAAPREGTRDSISVTFPEPLDHGLLLRAWACGATVRRS